MIRIFSLLKMYRYGRKKIEFAAVLRSRIMLMASAPGRQKDAALAPTPSLWLSWCKIQNCKHCDAAPAQTRKGSGSAILLSSSQFGIGSEVIFIYNHAKSAILMTNSLLWTSYFDIYVYI
jgi:hypothetical protein